MKEYTEEEVKEILDKIEAKDENVVKEVIQDLHPADIAELLQLPQVDMELAIYVFNLLDDETAAETLMELDEDKRHALLENILAIIHSCFHLSLVAMDDVVLENKIVLFLMLQ